MSQELMQKCVESHDIQGYIHHFGKKIHKVYPKLLEIEDAKNELWVAVFRAIQKRYTPGKPLTLFAKRAIFSQYGAMVEEHRGMARRWDERTINSIKDYYLDAHACIKKDDPSYAIVESRYTLDQIDKDLKARANTSRRYQYAVRTLGLMRRGVTIKQCCKQLQISLSYGYKIFNEIIRECSEKYREAPISTG